LSNDPSSELSVQSRDGYRCNQLAHRLQARARSQRYGHALAILHCALDGFNRFDDRFGHEAANDWLRAFVAGAAGCIRHADWLARTAGAEFVIVLPETTAKGAHCAAHKLRRLFAQHPPSTPAEPIGFTVSIRVTAVDAKHDSQSTAQVEAVLRAANRGTYASDGDHANADAMACTSGPSPRIGAKNVLN
jgi:diguanylate cyclase (GGDEF)-like protein